MKKNIREKGQSKSLNSKKINPQKKIKSSKKIYQKRRFSKKIVHKKMIKKHKGNYAFIDNENVNVSVQKM